MVPTSGMIKLVRLEPVVATLTALKPATWKLATESVLSTSLSFVSTLPELVVASSKIDKLSAVSCEGSL